VPGRNLQSQFNPRGSDEAVNFEHPTFNVEVIFRSGTMARSAWGSFIRQSGFVIVHATSAKRTGTPISPDSEEEPRKTGM
jgi:hypothetical protein